MKRKICLVVGLLMIMVTSQITAKEIKDSLFIKVQQAKNPDDQIRAYTNVLLYYSSRNLDSAIHFSKQAVAVFQATKDKVSEGRVYHTLANIYKDRLSYDTSLNYINKAFVLFTSINYDKGISKCYNTQGIIAAQKSNYTVAANYFMRSLKIAEKLGDMNGVIQGYANLGSVYGYLDNHQKALYYFKKAQEINQREFGVSYYKIFGNIASTYFELGKYDIALSYYKICIEKYEEIAVEMDDYITFLTEAGDCERELNNINNALMYYNKAYEMAIESDLQMQQADILLQLALLNYQNKNYSSSISFASKSIEIARKYELLDILVNALLVQSDAYAANSKFQMAYHTFKDYNIFKDSLQNFEQKKDVELLEAEYKVDKSQIRIIQPEKYTYKIYIFNSAFFLFNNCSFTLYFFEKKKCAER